MIRKTDIESGATYLLNEYDAGGLIENRVVRVTGISQSGRAWYDDHQGGGWMTTGSVEFEYTFARAKREGATGEFATSIEYAKEHWEQATPEEMKMAKARSKNVRRWERQRQREYWQNKMDPDM